MNGPASTKEIKFLVKIFPTKETLVYSFSGKIYQTYREKKNTNSRTNPSCYNASIHLTLNHKDIIRK